jgi:hypothetical protein
VYVACFDLDLNLVVGDVRELDSAHLNEFGSC